MQVAGEIALDTSVAIRYLNGDEAVVQRVLALANVILPLTLSVNCFLVLRTLPVPPRTCPVN
jgi:hypothetical protein